MERIMHTLTRK